MRDVLVRWILALPLLGLPATAAAQDALPSIDELQVAFLGSHDEGSIPGFTQGFWDFELTWTVPAGFDPAWQSMDYRAWNAGPLLTESDWDLEAPPGLAVVFTGRAGSCYDSAMPGETATAYVSVIHDAETGDTYWFAARIFWFDQDTMAFGYGPLSRSNAYFGTDGVAPSRIVDLEAESGQTIQLTWTASGDDGHVGRADEVDLRCSRSPILTEANFKAAQRLSWGVSIQPLPAPAEETANAMLPEGTWHFALKVRDEAFHWSPISNDALATVLPPADTTGTSGQRVDGSSSSGCSASGSGASGGLGVLLLLLPLAWWFGGRRRRLAVVGVALASLACSMDRPSGGSSGGIEPAPITISPPSAFAIYPESIAPVVGASRTLTARRTLPGGTRSAVAATWTVANSAVATIAASGGHVVVTGVAAGRTKVIATFDGLAAEAVVDVGGIDMFDPGPIYGCSEAGAVLTRYPGMGSPAVPTELWRAPGTLWTRGMGFSMSRSGKALWMYATPSEEEEAQQETCGMVYRRDMATGEVVPYGSLNGNDLPYNIRHYRGLDTALLHTELKPFDCVMAFGSDRSGNGSGFMTLWLDENGGGYGQGGGWDPVFGDMAATNNGETYFVLGTITPSDPVIRSGRWIEEAGKPTRDFAMAAILPALVAEGASCGISADDDSHVYVGGRKSGRVWRILDTSGNDPALDRDVDLFGELTHAAESSLVVNGITTTRTGGLLVNVVQGSEAVPAGIYYMIDFDGDGHADPDAGEVIRYSPHPVANTLDGGCIAAPR